MNYKTAIRPSHAFVVVTLALTFGWSAHVQAESLAAVITYPADGAVSADVSQPIQWTSVANVQAYYLYVGTTAGASNLVNTGEIQQTSYLAANLPAGQTLYARMWTNVGGVWRYVDSTFSAAPVVTARLTYPTNGAVDANLAQPIQWTSVANVQAYYLYVGTTAGANNLVNTGEIQQTSYLAAGLPAGQTVYARLWTKAGGVWRYTDSTFSAASVKATITSPGNGAANANPFIPIQWTSVADVREYYLYVGTAVGTNNLVNTGETLLTSYPAASLPLDQTLYARMWTKVGGTWRYSDSTFSLTLRATLIHPVNGAVAIDQMQSATWTSVPAAQMYYLYIGSTPGAKDLVDSDETQSTTLSISMAGPPLPAGPTLYARLWTKAGGVWRYRDSTFTASQIAPQFVYPTDGAVGVDSTQPFQWTPPANAQVHELHVGTSPGATDLFNSGQIAATSGAVTGLPPTGTLYARALSEVNGVWRYADIAFTLETSIPAAEIVVPAQGESAFDTVQPFEWSSVPLARGYRLTIGTTPSAADLHDSGDIHVTRRFVPNLPIGPLFGRLQTKIDGQWYARDFTFSVAANTVSAAVQIQSALWATDVVRSMALDDNHPFSWTELASLRFFVYCADYAATLLQVWTEMNGQLPARGLDVALNPNSYDTHTLVEMFNSETQSWMLFDPTFDVSVRRTSDGGWATAEDVSVATRTQQWRNVSYQFLGPLGDHYARTYILDYPLLFVNLYHNGQVPVNGQGGPVLPYMEPVAMPVSASRQPYAVGCSGEQTADLLIDGVEAVVNCSGVDGLSSVFFATTIETTAQTSATVIVYRPRRYVF